jgi:four helix bundle protein
MSDNKGVIAKLSFEFAIAIVNFYRHLIKQEKEYVMSKQLLRSATGIGALVREAQNAESKADFIHKLGIAQKECAESQYWLELLFATGYMDEKKFDPLYSSSKSLLNMIRSAIMTSKKGLAQKKRTNNP